MTGHLKKRIFTYAKNRRIATLTGPLWVRNEHGGSPYECRVAPMRSDLRCGSTVWSTDRSLEVPRSASARCIPRPAYWVRTGSIWCNTRDAAIRPNRAQAFECIGFEQDGRSAHAETSSCTENIVLSYGFQPMMAQGVPQSAEEMKMSETLVRGVQPTALLNPYLQLAMNGRLVSASESSLNAGRQRPRRS